MASSTFGGPLGGVAVVIMGVLVFVIGTIVVVRMRRANQLAQEKMEQALPGNPITPCPYFEPYRYQPPTQTVIDMTKVGPSSEHAVAPPPCYPGHAVSVTVTETDGTVPVPSSSQATLAVSAS
ncbi:hypothetical protein BGX29_011265 [Mortierella sp. GBA35]|nr:hypothetical protein BGX29_011265 [Mortierella sp. GBA35]